MIRVELHHALEVPLSVRADRQVGIRRAHGVHGDIVVDLDVPDDLPHPLVVDARPADDRPDLHGHQSRTLPHPQIRRRRKALRRLAQQRDDRQAALSAYRGLNPLREQRRQHLAAARPRQGNQLRGLTASGRQNPRGREPQPLGKVPCALGRERGRRLWNGVLIWVDHTSVEPCGFQKRRPSGDDIPPVTGVLAEVLQQIGQPVEIDEHPDSPPRRANVGMEGVPPALGLGFPLPLGMRCPCWGVPAVRMFVAVRPGVKVR